MEQFGVASVAEQFPEELSGGQAQRVQLARAVVLHPDVLLLDEVTSAIDPQTTKEVVEALYKLRSIEGSNQTCVIVTHLLPFAEKFADRIALLHAGRICEVLAAKDFMAYPKREETKEFLQAASWE
jgi:polar amino acid transport system ATP-binding protein